MTALGIDPTQVGWHLGTSREPRGVDLWVPFDRTTGVIGPQGSGKTLDLLTPALLHAPGAALVTLTKVEDLLLSLPERSQGDRPCVVLDPFGLATGVIDELVWDPISGCVDPKVAERRAKAFTAGTITGALSQGTGDDAARFYAAESAKVLQCLFHAAALTGRNLEQILGWIANPLGTSEPREILSQHPHAAPMWSQLLIKALTGDDRTAGNTITTVQQAMSLFFLPENLARCVPGHGRKVTDIAEVIARGGTIYLLGREDPYASASPFMTAVAEHVLDVGLELANTSPYGRLCPPLTAVLDELPSTAPLPTLRTRMANERALGLSFIWASQTKAQLDAIFGELEARALIGLTNVLVIFGGSKDVAFNQEVSDLLGEVRVPRIRRHSKLGNTSYDGDDIPVISRGEVRRIAERHALVIAENQRPILARLNRCIDGSRGKHLLAGQADLRAHLNTHLQSPERIHVRTTAAIEVAHELNLTPRQREGAQR